MDDSYILRCQRYIELNPLRARMVEDPAHYRWSSHRDNTSPTTEQLLTPHRACGWHSDLMRPAGIAR